MPRVSATSHSAVEDIDAAVSRLRAGGAELVGELERDEDSYRLCYVRGPEGIIVELARADGLTEPNANEANERESTRDG